MNFPFNPWERFIAVSVQLTGPAGQTTASFSLDTGATRTLVSRELIFRAGYALTDVADADLVPIVTASGRETAPIATVERLEALGVEHRFFPVLCHNMPGNTLFDGLLGLDFLRGQKLIIDFRAGLVTLE